MAVTPGEERHLFTLFEWEKDVIWDNRNINNEIVSKHCCWSTLSNVENAELVHGDWESQVIWDKDDVDMEILEPGIPTFDLNDDNIIFYMPEDIDPSNGITTTVQTQPEDTLIVKRKLIRPHVKKSERILGKVGIIELNRRSPSPPPSSENFIPRDPFYIGNDEYYQSKFEVAIAASKAEEVVVVQHPIPVEQLRAPFIPTLNMSTQELQNFHRPQLEKRFSGSLALPGPHTILPLIVKRISKKKARQPNFIISAEDLSGKDGEIVMVEYSEEHPPLLSQVGMCSKIKNYYKSKHDNEQPPRHKYGETTLFDKRTMSPFLLGATMYPGRLLSTLENKMYRSPIYSHATPETDFLLIRDQSNYYIREVNALYTAGQECPLIEVPRPKSIKAAAFLRNFLNVFIHRQFYKSQENPRKIRIENIKNAFPLIPESYIRKRLKVVADYHRKGAHNWWVLRPEIAFLCEDDVVKRVTPEQCCAYFSSIAAEQRLKDAGYGQEKCLFTPDDDEEDDNRQMKLADEEKAAPWNTSHAYIQAMKGVSFLQLDGPADPTGCGEGFSYVPVPKSKFRFPDKKMGQNGEIMEQQQEKANRIIVSGTDADLRRLSLDRAKEMMEKVGMARKDMGGLSRWEVVDLVRTLSSEKEKRGEGEASWMRKFSRVKKGAVAAELQQEWFKQESQRIFDLQCKVLSSSLVLSSDEEESENEEEDDETKKMGKTLEDIISSNKTSRELQFEEEERERVALLKKMLHGEDGDEGKKQKGDEKNKKKNKGGNNGRVLVINRTFKDPVDGTEYTRKEIIRNPAVVDVYMKIRTTKDDAFIRKFTLMSDKTAEAKRREKKSLREQMRRAKINEEKAAAARESHQQEMALSILQQVKLEPLSPSPPSRKTKTVRNSRIRCGACGELGHMKTCKMCPMSSKFNQTQIFAQPPLPRILIKKEKIEPKERQMTDSSWYDQNPENDIWICKIITRTARTRPLSAALPPPSTYPPLVVPPLRIDKKRIIPYQPRPVGRPPKNRRKMDNSSSYDQVQLSQIKQEVDDFQGFEHQLPLPGICISDIKNEPLTPPREDVHTSFNFYGDLRLSESEDEDKYGGIGALDDKEKIVLLDY